MKKKIEKKIIWKIAVFVIIGILGLVCISATLMAQTWGVTVQENDSYRISIDDDDTSSTEVFAVWHDIGGGVGSELFRITEDGYVGIGTTSPDAELVVIGDVKIDGHLGADNGKFFVDSTNHRVGINDDTPARKLEVLDESDTPQLRLTQMEDSHYTDFQTLAGGYLKILPSGGLVGIGCDPGAALSVSLDADVENVDLVTFQRTTDSPANGDSYDISFWHEDNNDEQDNFAEIRLIASDVVDTSEDGALAFRVAEDGSLGEAMRIIAGGNVGIGMTSPSYKLDVKAKSSIGTVTFTGSGLDDMTTGGTFTGATALDYIVEIDGEALESAITLANSLKASYNAHIACTTCHTAGADSTNGITSSDATDLSSLITLVTEMLTDYDAHEGDAELSSGWSYHSGQEASDHSLSSTSAPSDLGGCVARLNDFKSKYNDHDVDNSCHGGSASHHQDSTADAYDKDTFMWDDDGELSSDQKATGVVITGSTQNLNYGITITFGADDGHTLGESWTFSTTVTNPFSSQDATGTRVFHIGNDGNVGIGMTSPSYKLDVKAKSSIGTVTFSGSGLDDMTTGGTFTGATALDYIVEIDGEALESAITLANSLKGSYNAHITCTTCHTAGADSTNGITSSDATDLSSLITLVTEMLTDYDAHEGDAELSSGWSYHSGQEASDHSLSSTSAPTNLDECVARLNEFKEKYNEHDVDNSCHGGGASHHQDSTADAYDEDTFMWDDDGELTTDQKATGVAITGSTQNLNCGVTITFGADDGHTLEESWTFSTTVTNSFSVQDAAGTRVFHIGNDGNVGIGTTSPGSPLEVNGPIEIDSMRFIQGEEHYGNIGANHWFELFTAQHTGDNDEYEIWGTVVCGRKDFAHTAYMPFILTVKQWYGPLSEREPTIQFKYWKHGDLLGTQLLALRTSDDEATTKEIKLYVKAPTTWPTLNWEYYYNDDFFTIDQSPNDVGTSTPSGTSPDYYGDDLFGIDDGKVGIGTESKLSKLTVVGKSSSTLSGTVTKMISSNTVGGSGTRFLSEVGIGDRISVPGGSGTETKTVTAITSDNILTVDSNWASYATGQTATGYSSLFRVEDSSNAVKMVISDQGNVGIGTTSPTSNLHVIGLPSYANNAAAIAGGLTVGAFYRNGDNVCVVH